MHSFRGCDIDDLSVLKDAKSLEVLSLSVNKVQFLEPLKHCTKLKELYLRKNQIECLSELEHLKVKLCASVLSVHVLLFLEKT